MKRGLLLGAFSYCCGVVVVVVPVGLVGVVPVPGVVVVVPFELMPGVMVPLLLGETVIVPFGVPLGFVVVVVELFGTVVMAGDAGVVVEVPGVVVVVVPGVVVLVPGRVHGLVLLIDPELPAVVLPLAVAVPAVPGVAVLVHG